MNQQQFNEEYGRLFQLFWGQGTTLEQAISDTCEKMEDLSNRYPDLEAMYFESIRTSASNGSVEI